MCSVQIWGCMRRGNAHANSSAALLVGLAAFNPSPLLLRAVAHWSRKRGCVAPGLRISLDSRRTMLSLDEDGQYARFTLISSAHCSVFWATLFDRIVKILRTAVASTLLVARQAILASTRSDLHATRAIQLRGLGREARRVHGTLGNLWWFPLSTPQRALFNRASAPRTPSACHSWSRIR